MPRLPRPALDDDDDDGDEDKGDDRDDDRDARDRARTRDSIIRDRDVSFTDCNLDHACVASLRKCGYARPSPIQLAVLPLGRFGADVIAHAKSGTGKTMAFVIVAIACVDAKAPRRCRCATLAPTRESAVQTHGCFVEYINNFDAKDERRAIECALVVGGLAVRADRERLATQPHVVVGTPGRMRQLLEEGAMACDGVRLLVLDEADALLSGSFERDVMFTYNALPERKQVLAFSATYPPPLLDTLEKLMRAPQRVMLCESTTALQGVRQFYALIEEDEGKTLADVIVAKETRLLKIFADVAFHQAVVFVRRPAWGEALAKRLTSQGLKSAFTAGTLPQPRRMQVMEEMRKFQLRVLVSTDLTARGVDLTHVNLVVNLDVPPNGATYMHRIGRTGRFGSYGIAVAVLTGRELETLRASLVAERGGDIAPLPDIIPAKWYAYDLDENDAELFQTLKDAPIEVEEEQVQDDVETMNETAAVAFDAPSRGDDVWPNDRADRATDDAAYDAECAAYDAYWSSFLRRHPTHARRPRPFPTPLGCPPPWIVPAFHDDLVRLPSLIPRPPFSM